jgi:hypothetical protein
MVSRDALMTWEAISCAFIRSADLTLWPTSSSVNSPSTRYLLGTAYLHLGYVVCNQFTELHEEAFRRWTMLRHHEWTSALDHSIRAEAVTVAVMLTPRHDAVRPWDTTVFAIFGDQELDPGDVAAAHLYLRSSKEIRRQPLNRTLGMLISEMTARTDCRRPQGCGFHPGHSPS